MTRAWGQFFESCASDGLGPLGQRATTLARQIRDNGVTYNVYADEDGPQRPWSLGLFPLIISAQSWQQIEAGVSQRVRLLDHLMADVYGPQQLVAQGLLPPALVQGHPGYLRATILRLLGFDHTKLTFRYNGRDFRLTDNFGKVVDKVIA